MKVGVKRVVVVVVAVVVAGMVVSVVSVVSGSGVIHPSDTPVQFGGFVGQAFTSSIFISSSIDFSYPAASFHLNLSCARKSHQNE